MSLSKLTGAPTELVLGEKKYLMSPLTDRDIAELDEYVQARFIANARASCQGCSDAEYERTMRLAMREAIGLTWTQPPGNKVIMTTSGLARLTWQGVRKNHPDVTLDELHEAMFDPRNVSEMKRQFEKANHVPEVRAKEALPGQGDSRPTRRRKSMQP